jgi:hypothetical protein
MYTIDEIKKLPLEERKEVLGLLAQLKKKKAAVVAGVTRIPKNGYNTFHKYHYSTESDVKEGVRTLLSENGLTLDTELVEDKKEIVKTKQGEQWLTTVKMMFTLTDNDTGYMDIQYNKAEATDSGDKGLYKAYSGCIKYYFLNNFQIASGDDPEQGESDQIIKEDKKQQQRGRQGGNDNKRKPDKPKVTKATLEAKWKQLNNGSLDGLDEYLEKKAAEGKDYSHVDAILLGSIQKKQAQEAKAKKEQEQAKKEQEQQEQKTNIDITPEEIDKALQEEQGAKVTDVADGKTYIHNGKEIVLD